MEQLSIEMRKLDSLIPFEQNAKLHSDTQIAKIAKSIKSFGFNNPVLIDKESGIIAGHGRVLAAKKLQLKEIPCIVLGHLTETQKKAYIISDNRLGEIGGGWDMEILKREFESLIDQELNFDLEDIGFDDAFTRIFEADDQTGLGFGAGELQPDRERYGGYKSVVVHLANQTDADNLSKLLGQPITKKTRTLCFPAH